jgi:hypothetical protein
VHTILIKTTTETLLQIVHRVIATFLIKQAGLKRTAAHTGAITLMLNAERAARPTALHGAAGSRNTTKPTNAVNMRDRR